MTQSKDGEHILRFWTQFGNNIGYRFTESLRALIVCVSWGVVRSIQWRCKIPRRSPPNI